MWRKTEEAGGREGEGENGEGARERGEGGKEEDGKGGAMFTARVYNIRASVCGSSLEVRE